MGDRILFFNRFTTLASINTFSRSKRCEECKEAKVGVGSSPREKIIYSCLLWKDREGVLKGVSVTSHPYSPQSFSLPKVCQDLSLNLLYIFPRSSILMASFLVLSLWISFFLLPFWQIELYTLPQAFQIWKFVKNYYAYIISLLTNLSLFCWYAL